jgi:hypothetical protein
VKADVATGTDDEQAVRDERVEVRVQVQSATAAMDGDDCARGSVAAPQALAQVPEDRPEEDADDVAQEVGARGDEQPQVVRANVVDTTPILPKLFRRLAAHLKTADSLTGFVAYLKQHPDPCILIEGADPTSLHALVRVGGGKVRLTVLPEQIMFKPK